MEYVTTDKMRMTGRNLTANEKPLPDIFVSYNCDFSSANEYQFSFADSNQLKQFGIVESIFADNSSNPNEIEVSVSGTDQFFTIPAYAQGHFIISGAASSVITLVSNGGATDIVTINFYNYKVPPAVWYRYGSINNNVPIPVFGCMDPGDDVAAENNNRPVYIGGVDTNGDFRGIQTDTDGRIYIAGSVSLSGSITINDGSDVALGAKADAAVTNPVSSASLIAATKGVLTGVGQTTDAVVTLGGNGNIIQQLKAVSAALGATSSATTTNPATNSPLISFVRGLLTANGQVADASVSSGGSGNQIQQLKGLNTVSGAQADAAVTNPASSGSIVALLKGILTGINSLFSYRTPANATNTNVASSAASVTILASNASRKGATVYNDSTVVLYLNLDNSVASTSNYTVQLASNSYYEIPFGYTGEIRGIWASATGNARITEFS